MKTDEKKKEMTNSSSASTGTQPATSSAPKNASTKKKRPNKKKLKQNGSTKSGTPASNSSYQDITKNRQPDGESYSTTNNAPRAGASPVYPSSSAAASAFGSFTTSPGQDNFIEQWNDVTHEPSIGVLREVAALADAKRTPNAMRIDYVPYFGALMATRSNKFMSPIRQAALNMKQYIDTSFGTRTDYDPNDLIVYIMACEALWDMAAECRRDLKLTYTGLNNREFPQFLPTGLFALLEIGDENHNTSRGEGYLYTAKNLRSYIDQFNRIVTLINRLPMPRELAVFGYNDRFFDSIFADTPDLATAQLYVFKTSHYWVYRDVVSELGSHLQLKQWTRGATLAEKLQELEQAALEVSAMRTSDTNMLQNLFNAYGTKEFARMELLEWEHLDGLPIEYDENILTMIENMNWGAIGNETTQVTDIQVLKGSAVIEGHICAHTNVASRWPNLPLQFHKPMTSVTNDDIGWALRMHPIFMNNTTFQQYDIVEVEGVETVVQTTNQGMTADGYTGFAIPGQIKVIRFSDAGYFDILTWNYRGANQNTAYYQSIFNDFAHAPMFVGTVLDTPDEHHANLTLQWYDAHRDVEMTYRLGDVEMFWTYLTEDLYAGNIIRETLGTRKMQWQH